MDYSKISFSTKQSPTNFPGTQQYLLYPHSREKNPIFILPIRFSVCRQKADSVFSPSFGDRYLLFYCLEGDGLLSFRGQRIPCRKGTGAFLYGNDLSDITSGSGSMQYTLYILTGALCREMYQVFEKQKAFFFSSDSFPDFEQRQFMLVKKYPGTLSGKAYDFSSHMNLLLTRILHFARENKNPENDHHHQMMQQVVTYMQAHFSEELTTRELAGQFHYSVSQFQKYFQEQIHDTPKQYLIRIRIQEAEKFLLSTNLTIEEIGRRCGFQNANHFIRVFRKYYGKTPLQYRKIVSGHQMSDCVNASSILLVANAKKES